MPSMPWIKLWIEMLDDVKLAELGDSQKWRFVQLVLLAAECDAAGALVTGDSRMTHAQVAWRLRCDKSVIEVDINKMIELGLITDDGAITVTNFSKRQGPTQAEKRQQWAERQQKHRQRAVNPDNVTRDSLVTHANVTPLDKDKEEDKEIEKETTTTETAAEISSAWQPEKDVVVVFTLWENNVGIVTPIIADTLKDWIDTYPEDWITDAITEGVERNGRNVKYIGKILQNWQEKGRGDNRKNGNGKGELIPGSPEDRARYTSGKFAETIKTE